MIALDLPQLSVWIGYSSSIFSGRIYHSNVIILGIIQQSNDINKVIRQGIRQQGFKFRDFLVM